MPGPLVALDHDDEQHHADGDGRVGHVEGRPGRQLEEVGDGAEPCAIDDVAERAAQQQPGRQPDERAAGVHGEVGQQRRERGGHDHDDRRAAPGEGAERDAVVADVHEVDEAEQVPALARAHAAADDGLGRLVGGDRGAGDERRARPRPAAAHS
jgi:hypothetical protein